jgi:hypothetical protein
LILKRGVPHVLTSAEKVEGTGLIVGTEDAFKNGLIVMPTITEGKHPSHAKICVTCIEKKKLVQSKLTIAKFVRIGE